MAVFIQCTVELGHGNGGVYSLDEACRSKNDPVTDGGGRSHQGKMLVVGAVEVEDGGLGPDNSSLALSGGKLL
jgi:hypothetical protein